MNKEEILSKVTESVGKIKHETSPLIFSDYSTSPFFDLSTGEETGLFVVFFCSSQSVISEGLLKYWKELIGANDYEFYRFDHSSQLCVTFFVDYDKYEVKDSETDRIKMEINKAI